MQSSWNVIRICFASVASVALLTNCQGQDGFQSRKFTPAEQAKYLKAQQAVAGNSGTTSKAETDSSAPVIPPVIDPATGAKPAHGGPNGVPTPAPSYTGPHAQSVVISEGESLLQLLQRNLDDLQNPIKSDEATAIFKNIDIDIAPTTPAGKFNVAVKATVVMDGKTRELSVPTQQFGYNSDNTITYLAILLNEVNGDGTAGVSVDTKSRPVVGSVTCDDTTCTKGFEVRFDFQATPPVPSVFFVQNDATGSHIRLTNLRAIPQGYKDAHQKKQDPPKEQVQDGGTNPLEGFAKANQAANPHDEKAPAATAPAKPNDPRQDAAPAKPAPGNDGAVNSGGAVNSPDSFAKAYRAANPHDEKAPAATAPAATAPAVGNNGAANSLDSFVKANQAANPHGETAPAAPTIKPPATVHSNAEYQDWLQQQQQGATTTAPAAATPPASAGSPEAQALMNGTQPL